MGYHTFVAGEVLTAANVNTYLMNQAVIVCTSGTRPASPTAGMLIWETDTNTNRMWDGAAWQVVITRGVIARVTSIAVTAGITTQTVYSGMADLAFTTTAGRRYKVTLLLNVESTVAGDSVDISIRDGAGSAPTTGSTLVNLLRLPGISVASRTAQYGYSFDWTPSAGAHDLGVFATRQVGTGTVSIGNASYTSYLIVEDVGV